jgi:hypothetical protein
VVVVVVIVVVIVVVVAAAVVVVVVVVVVEGGGGRKGGGAVVTEVVVAAAAVVVLAGCADFDAKVDLFCGPVLVGYLMTLSIPGIIQRRVTKIDKRSTLNFRHQEVAIGLRSCNFMRVTQKCETIVYINLLKPSGNFTYHQV